jgi:hypothetical protein
MPGKTGHGLPTGCIRTAQPRPDFGQGLSLFQTLGKDLNRVEFQAQVFRLIRT